MDGEVIDRNDVFIVKVTGTTSRTINIPDSVCEFANVSLGNIMKLQILEIKKADDKNKVMERDDIFIVKVTGKNTKTINIPDAVCDFSGLSNSDLVKLKILEIKSDFKKQK